MLTQKKISKNKLVFYIILIGVMIFAIGFMIYKNYKLNAANQDRKFDNILEMNNIEDTDIAVNEETAGGSSIPALDIFNNSKFRALKRNVLKRVNIVVGKEDPFEIRKQE